MARFEILKSRSERQLAKKLWQGAAKEAMRLADFPRSKCDLETVGRCCEEAARVPAGEADGSTLQAVPTTRHDAWLYAGARPIPFSPSQHPDVLDAEDVNGLRIREPRPPMMMD
eukprot:12552878-Heterocapsa_arctica.AAC.1